MLGLINTSGDIYCQYVYDSWGKLVSIKDANGNDKTNDLSFYGTKNPFRYRGYYYDTETGMYYLQSRYYNPEWGRFLNGDSLLTPDMMGKNMFAYALNNPVNKMDPDGHKTVTLTDSEFYNYYFPYYSPGNNTFSFVHYDIDYEFNYKGVKKIVHATKRPNVLVNVAKAITSANPITHAIKIIHYGRNANNQVPGNSVKAFSTAGWIPSNDPYGRGASAQTHNFTSADKSNIKWISPDGHSEAIFDAKGNIVLSAEDMGTYNYYSPTEHPILHGIFDVAPWVVLGNSPDDSTRWYQRLGSLLGL